MSSYPINNDNCLFLFAFVLCAFCSPLLLPEKCGSLLFIAWFVLIQNGNPSGWLTRESATTRMPLSLPGCMQEWRTCDARSRSVFFFSPRLFRFVCASLVLVRKRERERAKIRFFCREDEKGLFFFSFLTRILMRAVQAGRGQSREPNTHTQTGQKSQHAPHRQTRRI